MISFKYIFLIIIYIYKYNIQYIYRSFDKWISVLLTLSWILTFSWPLFRLGARRTLLVTGGSIMMIDVALSSGVHPWWKLDSLTSYSAIKKTNVFFNLRKQYIYFFFFWEISIITFVYNYRYRKFYEWNFP